MLKPTKIQSKLLMAAAISVLLVACKSTPIADKPAAVEDKSPNAY